MVQDDGGGDADTTSLHPPTPPSHDNLLAATVILVACKDRRETWKKYEHGFEDVATRLFDALELVRIGLKLFKHGC